MVRKSYELYDDEGNVIEQSTVVFADIPYDRIRKEEFSKIDGEGMDAIRREIDAIRIGKPQTDEYLSYRSKVQEIKNKYPKPEEK